jgi:hypothetical protein
MVLMLYHVRLMKVSPTRLSLRIVPLKQRNPESLQLISGLLLPHPIVTLRLEHAEYPLLRWTRIALDDDAEDRPAVNAAFQVCLPSLVGDVVLSETVEHDGAVRDPCAGLADFVCANGEHMKSRRRRAPYRRRGSR